MTARYPLVLNGTTIEEVQSADTLTGLTSGNSILAGDNSGGIKNVSLSGDISFDGNTLTVSAVAFPAGTVMLFIQAAAPTGWTKSTTHNDKALRIVSGSGGGSGGSVAFSTAFASGSTGATTLATSQLASHGHAIPVGYSDNNGNRLHLGAAWQSGSGYGVSGLGNNAYSGELSGFSQGGRSPVSAAGSGGSHSHSLSLAVQYVDAIICVKD